MFATRYLTSRTTRHLNITSRQYSRSMAAFLLSPLVELRTLLAEQGVEAFLIGSGDAHQSEYVPACDQRRQFISGFTGSAGTALVTSTRALLWTDGRYFAQATQELSNDWELMRSGMPDVPEIPEWLGKNLKAGQVVGIDATLFSATYAKRLKSALSKHDIELKCCDSNPIDRVWGSRRPAPPMFAPVAHEEVYAGQNFREKIAAVQEILVKDNYQAMVITMLDEVAWLFNIRGCDVPYNPVAVSYAILTQHTSHLFIHPDKVTDGLRTHLGDAVIIHYYSDIEPFLSQQAVLGKVLADGSQLNYSLYLSIENAIVDKPSPVSLMKAVKNSVELQGAREAHVRDGVALTAFLAFLEQQITQQASVTECAAAEILEKYRSQMDLFVGPSFATIAGYGANGAIIHYHAQPETCATIGTDSLFLLDSGAQYKDGTTDVTRTVHFGHPTDHMRRCFTLVLKGHISLARCVFPENTTGSRLDSLARMHLWEHGLDYNHGTGHGVGSYLNVHEGPHGIGSRIRENERGFKLGMLTSNEPGYYEEGNFGIRIENLCITTEAHTPHNFNNKKYCTFETMTLCPIQSKLIDVTMLTADEVAWVNAYHAKVRRTLLPHMERHFPDAVAYLIRETESI